LKHACLFRQTAESSAAADLAWRRRWRWRRRRRRRRKVYSELTQ